MSASRFVYSIDLESGSRGRHWRPDILPDLSAASVDSRGKCATIHAFQGVMYVGAHSLCASALWRVAGGVDASRPAVPWVAFRGVSAADAAAIAWAWMEQRGL